MSRRQSLVGAAVALAAAGSLLIGGPAHAQVAPTPAATPTTPSAPLGAAVTPPTPPTPPATPGSGSSGTTLPGQATISLNLGSSTNRPSDSLNIIILLTLLAVAPALLMMLTSFTRIVVVLSLTRNAMGLQAIPPNQVVVGLALFLSLFVMSPVLKQMNTDAVQPYLHGKLTQGQAYSAGRKPLHAWMIKQTRSSELALFVNAQGQGPPKSPDDVSMTALVPAFVLSELKSAFIIGFVIFIPFLVIDIIVSSSLMSMGMMMLPPVLVSLPFKILLFVLVDGWALVARSLLTSFR